MEPTEGSLSDRTLKEALHPDQQEVQRLQQRRAVSRVSTTIRVDKQCRLTQAPDIDHNKAISPADRLKMATPDSPMPGSFVYDNPIPPKLDLAGASSVFQPPSPISAASSLCRTIKSNGGSSRKRQRFDRGDDDSIRSFNPNSSLRSHMNADDRYFSRNNHASPLGQRGSTNSWISPSETSNGLMSPAPFVNTDYRFAGGLDASSASLALARENEEYNGQELDYRPNRYRQFTEQAPDNYPIETTVQSGNGRKRARPSSSSSSSPQKPNGWGKAVFHMVGGVAGKVWDFCWSGAFRGFHAGGGVGYQMETPPQPRDQDTWQTDSGNHLFRSHSREDVPVPGRFPNPVEETSRGLDADDLNSNWILVKNEEPESGQSSPTRKAPRRTSSVARPITPRRAVTARTGRRSGVMTPARPSASPHTPYASAKTTQSPTKTDKAGSAEAQRYAAKMRRREREEEASMRRLNQQMQAMIKEGREALGTKIEVDEMEVEDSD
ncbi:hypothetical protein FQN54_003020 [Arachnomyces sp. PD_36]|nr:hypothetical protein FQN54_003020 [Arachnomyces sp. PD_36]